MSFPFQIKKSYHFEVYPPSLGNDFKNVTILGILDFDTAHRFADLHVRHPLYYPSLPAGTVNDPTAFTYLRIRTEGGEERIIALEWIRQESIVQVDSASVVVRFNQFTVTDIPTLRQVLAENGFTNFTITQTD